MNKGLDRREFIQKVGIAAAGFGLTPSALWAKAAPSAPVAVAKCAGYDSGVTTALSTMFDQLGGLDRLVNGKTVAIKLNVTGSPPNFFHNLPVGETYWVNPQVVGSLIHLLGSAGARRIRLVESPTGSKLATLQEFFSLANWDVSALASAAPRVEFENTNYPGPSGKYARFWVPGGGLLFPAYEMSRAYEDCDVFVSLAKLKEHATAGVTLSMKNCFGNTPTTIYGDGVGKDEPSSVPEGARLGILHHGKRQPPKSSLAELDPHSPRDPGYRVPRIVADLVAARPIHLAVIDGIETAAGGEGPWVKNFRTVRPGLLIAGTNCVTTDSVATALMGFDPMADRGTAPFEPGDNTLKLAEQLGIGTCDLRRIEVRGVPIEQGRMDFRRA
jgi:uncharacterized protein (DUF362 family)